MGLYINELPAGHKITEDKVQSIVSVGGIVISQPPKLVDNLICVVNNVVFQSAAYVASERDFNDFTDPSDTRSKTWIIWNRAKEFAR